MRTASWSLLALSCLLGCPDDGSGNTTSLTTNSTTNGSATDTGDSNGDGDGDPGDGDPGDGDGDPGDGDGDPGDGDGYCQHQCMSDADCLAMGMDLGYMCIDSVCTLESSGCTTDDECISLLSGWTTPCASANDCPNQVCIDIGLCATPPSDFIMCDVLNMVEFQTTDIDGNPVTVCAQLGAICSDDNFCFVPCQSDDDCSLDAYPICDVGTGFCQCGSDADCATIGQPASSVCNAGVCGCNDDQQCIDSNLGDVCTGLGFCGCTNDMACAGFTNPFDGGGFACVQS